MNRRGRPNRQPRGPSEPNRPSRTNHTSSSTSRPALHSVPPHASIQPGTGVSIILKADQPTGRTVHGIVADLLTRGDHARGVKVRLRDGRVGRVQALVSAEQGERGEALVGGAGALLGRNGEGGGAGAARRVGGRIERDVREEDEYLFDESCAGRGTEGLFGALEEADRRHREQLSRGGDGGGLGKLESEIVACPVCGEFEGDESAVAFHVESHFGE